MPKKQTQEKTPNWILVNLAKAAVFFIVLILGAQIFLKVVTRHGKTVEVPDFTNMTLKEASAAARSSELRIKVTDSVFVKRLAAGVVFRQTPKAGASVKKGRNISITINSVVPRKTPMPNLVGYSLPEAKTELMNHSLILGRLNYVNDIATNNVISQSLGGREVKPGTSVITGSEIDLTVGLNPSESRTTVPRVIGLKYISAVDALHNKFLNVGKVRFDPGIRTYADSLDAMVYKQDVAKGSARTMGSPVSLWLTLDESKIPAK